MTSDRDIEQVLDRWFTERPTGVADRVLDGVADRIGRQPQQPAWRASRRDIHVPTNLKPLLAVAAVIVIAVAGFAVLQPRSGSSVGGAPTSSPTASASPVASASPTASPSASAVFPSWFPASSEGAGILPAGGQTTRTFLPGSTFTVPDGWVNDLDNPFQYSLFPDTSANQAEYALREDVAQSILLTPMVSNNMFTICDSTLMQGATAAEIVDGIVANEALITSEPVEVTIGGMSGLQIDTRLDPDWTGPCSPTPDDPPARDFKDLRNRIIVLDRTSETLPLDRRTIGIAIGSTHAADFDAFLAEAMSIVESWQFDLTP